jgi:mRNA interferase RelE/StbE
VNYTVRASKEVKKFIERLRDEKLKGRIVAAIESLAENPRPPGCLQMQGRELLHRLRVGDYRIIYQIRDAELMVLVVTIGNRRDVYR